MHLQEEGKGAVMLIDNYPEQGILFTFGLTSLTLCQVDHGPYKLTMRAANGKHMKIDNMISTVAFKSIFAIPGSCVLTRTG